MSDSRTSWKRRAGYLSFASFAFVFGLYVTFPYETLRERIRAEADAAGYFVKIGSLGPGFFGLRAKNVQVSKKIADGEDGSPEALTLDTLSLGPSIFPIGLSASADLLGGDLDASVGVLGDLKVNLTAKGIDPTKGNFKAFTGVDLSGLLNAKVALAIPQTQLPGQKTKQPDFGQATGNITLEGDGLTVNGGTVTVPIMGEMTPMDLPKIAFGDLDGKLVFDKGAGTLETFTVKGQDLEVRGEGTVKLARRIDFTDLRLKVALKAENDFVKRLGLIGSGLSMLPADPKDPNFRVASITGLLNRPQFTPGAR